MTERWVEWIEPFGPNNEPVYMRVPESTAIATQKAIVAKHPYGNCYQNDRDALWDFVLVHWANCTPPID